MTKSLIDILTGTLNGDSSWGIYAEKMDGEFKAESPARFGQRQFKNGGLSDDCELFANNEYANAHIDGALGRSDGRAEDTITESDKVEAAVSLIEWINEQK
jgi:hypothetical protein